MAHFAYGSRVGVILDHFGGLRITRSAGSVAPVTVTSLAVLLLLLLFSALLFSIAGIGAVLSWRRLLSSFQCQ
jgi:hypothetical protein